MEPSNPNLASTKSSSVSSLTPSRDSMSVPSLQALAAVELRSEFLEKMNQDCRMYYVPLATHFGGSGGGSASSGNAIHHGSSDSRPKKSWLGREKNNKKNETTNSDVASGSSQLSRMRSRIGRTLSSAVVPALVIAGSADGSKTGSSSGGSLSGSGSGGDTKSIARRPIEGCLKGYMHKAALSLVLDFAIPSSPLFLLGSGRTQQASGPNQNTTVSLLKRALKMRATRLGADPVKQQENVDIFLPRVLETLNDESVVVHLYRRLMRGSDAGAGGSSGPPGDVVAELLYLLSVDEGEDAGDNVVVHFESIDEATVGGGGAVKLAEGRARVPETYKIVAGVERGSLTMVRYGFWSRTDGGPS